MGFSQVAPWGHALKLVNKMDPFENISSPLPPECDILRQLDHLDAQLDTLLSTVEQSSSDESNVLQSRIKLHIYSTSSIQEEQAMEQTQPIGPPSYYTVHIKLSLLDENGEVMEPPPEGLLARYFTSIMLDTPTGTVVWHRRFHSMRLHKLRQDNENEESVNIPLSPLFNTNYLDISRVGTRDVLVSLYFFPDLTIATFTVSHALLTFLRKINKRNPSDYACTTLTALVETIWSYGLQKGLIVWLPNKTVGLTANSEVATLFHIKQSQILSIAELTRLLVPHLFPPLPIKIDHFVKIAGPASENEIIANLLVPRSPNLDNEALDAENRAIQDLEKRIACSLRSQDMYEQLSHGIGEVIEGMFAKHHLSITNNVAEDNIIKEPWLTETVERWVTCHERSAFDLVINTFDIPASSI
ncbi:hypothetical protein BdWA1_002487 [Babesia duncani]|uniref:Uncharacterized protein n=1 Tax=Babesia duncani TaxID=323732 RepID=A0AAD9PJK8_9APIC|nr:hypothetical protein BdWA1_002487 [Babesia duncani]